MDSYFILELFKFMAETKESLIEIKGLLTTQGEKIANLDTTIAAEKEQVALILQKLDELESEQPEVAALAGEIKDLLVSSTANIESAAAGVSAINPDEVLPPVDENPAPPSDPANPNPEPEVPPEPAPLPL